MAKFNYRITITRLKNYTFLDCISLNSYYTNSIYADMSIDEYNE